LSRRWAKAPLQKVDGWDSDLNCEMTTCNGGGERKKSWERDSKVEKGPQGVHFDGETGGKDEGKKRLKHRQKGRKRWKLNWRGWKSKKPRKSTGRGEGKGKKKADGFRRLGPQKN